MILTLRKHCGRCIRQWPVGLPRCGGEVLLPLDQTHCHLKCIYSGVDCDLLHLWPVALIDWIIARVPASAKVLITSAYQCTHPVTVTLCMDETMMMMLMSTMTIVPADGYLDAPGGGGVGTQTGMLDHIYWEFLAASPNGALGVLRAMINMLLWFCSVSVLLMLLCRGFWVLFR